MAAAVSSREHHVSHLGAAISRRALVAYEGEDRVQLDFPTSFAKSDYFTLFWRGRAAVDNFREFIGDARRTTGFVSSLFYFAQGKVRLPALEDSKSRLALEGRLLDAYGEPGFVRYEAYSTFNWGDLRECRYALWGELTSHQHLRSSPSVRRELGVYTTLRELELGELGPLISELIKVTIVPEINREVSSALLEEAQRLLRSKVE